MSFYGFTKARHTKIFTEIGERKPPLKKDFTFTKEDIFNYRTNFTDDDGEQIDIIFQCYANKKYNVVYAYGENDDSHKKVTMNIFFNILSTVTQAILEFLEKIDPNELRISGGGSEERKNKQKSKIYLNYIRVNIDKKLWHCSENSEELIVTKIDPVEASKLNEDWKSFVEWTFKIMNESNKNE